MSKEKETQAYKTYVLNYNVMYHDYGMSEKAIEAQLGPEPQRWEAVTELDVIDDDPNLFIPADIDEQLEALRELDAVYVQASGQRGY